MTPETATAIREHALAEYPHECCGLLVVVRGRERYYRCVNKAKTRSEHFVIGADDYAFAEDMGEITAVVHSHPDVAARASEADKVACEASGLPWYIASVIRDRDQLTVREIGSITPEGYQAPLVGREFHHGVLDCYTLVQDFYSRELGIQLPNFERRDNWWNTGENLYLDHFREAGCEPITGPMQRGDIILIQLRAPVPNHAAVYLGNGLILHHLYGRLSSRDVYGSTMREYTRLVVRHRDIGAILASQADATSEAVEQG